jgi:3-deoxy-7-phosphoheptulonate synthase
LKKSSNVGTEANASVFLLVQTRSTVDEEGRIRMIVSIRETAKPGADERVLALALAIGLEPRVLRYDDGAVVIGLDGSLPLDDLPLDDSIRVYQPGKPYRLASREHRQQTVVRVGGVAVGGSAPVLMAGPCVVESTEQMIEAALAVQAAGATILRGGAYKPRTSPYSFQGLGVLGLEALAAAREVTGLPFVTEVLEPEQVETVASYADMLQIGARNMANTPLLRRAGRSGKPVLLKRGFSATIEEWLMSAEYILSEGNPNVILCERGIRGFDPAVRFNLDLNAVPLAKELTHLPVIVDPSHGTGIRSLVGSMALAGIAAGADGLIIEAQPQPDDAKCDAYQTISPEELASISLRCQAIAEIVRNPMPVLDPTAVEIIAVA